jgi:threonine dehydrogenase-like Zn-dependent dehydrogenase
MVAFKTFRGGKDGIRESKTEKPIGPDEVLIRVTHSGLCGTDLHYKGADMVLGHEGVGIVDAIGDKVTLFKK